MDRYLPIKHAWVDSSRAPLYQVSFPAHASDEKLLSYCRAVESWSAHVTYPVAWLMDLSRVEQVSAQQRAIFAKYMQGMEDFDRRCTKGSALILPNALMRGIATAIFWLYSPRFEHRTFAACAEGLSWLREVLSEAGVESDPGTSDMRDPSALERFSAPPRGPASAFPEGSASASIPAGRMSVPPSDSVAPPLRGNARSPR
jgi:hypothetical protein